MTEGLKTVQEHVNIEIWQHEDRSLGFRLSPVGNYEPSLQNLSEMTHYVATALLENLHGSTALFSTSVLSNGEGQVYWEKGLNFSQWREYKWMRRSTQQSMWQGPCGLQETVFLKILSPSWFFEWCVMRLIKRFKCLQKAAAPGAAPGHTMPREDVSEHSTASRGIPPQGGGVVLPFPPRKPSLPPRKPPFPPRKPR